MKLLFVVYSVALLAACAAVKNPPVPGTIFSNDAEHWRESRGLRPYNF